MNDITKFEEQQTEVYRPSAAIDPKRLEYLWTLAERMASSTLVPESLRTTGPKNNKKNLSREEVVANVFAVVEQADRWNQSPWALLSCAAIVHGKLGFEGKVIAAVLEANYGISLRPYYKGQPQTENYHVYLCDEDLPDDVIDALEPGYRHPRYKIMDGSVKEWKTTGEGSPWRPATYAKMLVYRGEREWARVYKAAAIMGVLADDELASIEMEHRAQIARDVTPSLANRFGGNRREGFNADNIKQLSNDSAAPVEMVDTKTGEVIDAETVSSSAQPRTASADEGGGSGRTSTVDAAATNSNSSQPPSSQAEDDKAAESGTPPTGSAAAKFVFTADEAKKYASWLARQSDPEKVERGSAHFFEKEGRSPEKGSAEHRLFGSIFLRNKERAAGKIDAAGLLEEITAEIDTLYGLDTFPGDA